MMATRFFASGICLFCARNIRSSTWTVSFHKRLVKERSFSSFIENRLYSKHTTLLNARNDTDAVTLHSAAKSVSDGIPNLQLTWEDGSKSHFPFIFLRDNCQCNACFEASAKQRLVNTALSVDVNIEARYVQYDVNNQNITLTWPDDHQSIFESMWLKDRELPRSKEEQISKSKSYFPKKTFWDGSFNVPTADFESILNDDKACYNWLSDLAVHGLTMIKDAPKEPFQLQKISERVGGYIRETHYGAVFEVISKPDPSSIAYSGLETPLHVDLAYYMYQPGTQYLHCIKQTEDRQGGENYLVDGFSIAEKFRIENPEVFDILTKKKFTFRDIGKDYYGEFEKMFERPIVGTNEFGDYTSIAYNNFTRSSFVNVPMPELYRLYEAYYMWTKEIGSKENQIRCKLQPGEIWVFDNLRILHARAKFDASKSERHFQGMYIDWDEVYSKLRVLRRRLGMVTNDANAF